MSNIFRKHLPPLGVENKVSGADRKKLRRALEKAFPSMSEEELEAVMPSKAGELISIKLQAPRREVLYRLEELPVLLDTSNKMDLVPTIFALWKAPNLLPRIYVKHPAVTQFIVGGADLMLPGVHIPAEGLPPFKKGDLLAVCVHGNSCPLAVGLAGMSSQDTLSKKGGKLVEVVQAYGDCLWEVLGGRQVPNDGFLANAVVPEGLGQAGLDTSGYEEDESGQPILAAAATPAADASADGLPGADQAADALQQGLNLGDGTGASGAAGSQGAGSASGNAAARGGIEVPESMDELLEMTLLQALHRSIKDDMLPLASSVLWAQHLQPSRPAGSTLDVKKSAHKKLSTFLKAYGAKGGLLTLKEDKHSGDQVLTSINRNHELYETFRPYRLALTAGGSDGAAEQGGAAAAGSAASSGSASGLIVEDMWKPGKETRPVFDALGQPFDALYTAAELGDVAFAYITHAELTKNAPDPRTVILDATLCDALYKGVIKKGELYPSQISKSEVREAFLRRCSAQCRITRGDQVVIKKGTLPCVVVNVEKRQGNKRVTRIVGLEPFLVSPEAVASECQKRFASSSTVNELPGKNQGHEVVVQGNVIEKMSAFLQDKFSIPSKYITVKA